MIQYHLGAIEFDKNGENSVTGIRELTSEEHLEYKKHNQSIGVHLQNKKLLELIVNNGEELERYIEEVYSSTNLQVTYGKDVIFETNRLIMNYLSMIKTYDDHISKRLSDTFSKEDKDGFKEFLSKLYDEFFVYRFLARLRNYAQHFSFPIHNFVNSVNGKKIYMERQSLLAYEGWSKVRSELEHLNEKIEVKGLAYEMNDIMKQAYLYVLKLNSNNVISAYKWLESIVIELNMKEPIIIQIDPNEPSKDKLSLTKINTEGILEAIKDLNEHPNININYK
jgi:hypothetical protein